MASMIAVTGHHVGMCCPFCEVELHAGDPAVCLNADCFLFGYPAPLPVQRMIPDRRQRGSSDAVSVFGAAELLRTRRTSSMGPG